MQPANIDTKSLATSGMQIETRYRFIFTRVAIIKKIHNNFCWKYGTIGTLRHGGRNVKWCSLFGKQSGNSSNVYHVTQWYNLCWHKNLYIIFTEFFITLGQNHPMSINWWMDKQNVVYPYFEELTCQFYYPL